MQPQAMQQQASQFLDFYRTGLRTASDMMKASLESAERMQQQQFQAVRTALEENVKSVNQLADARSLEELVSVQTRMAGAQMETMMNLWSGMWRLAGDSQGMLRQAVEKRPAQFEPQPSREPQPQHRKSA
jgi:phasin family protein